MPESISEHDHNDETQLRPLQKPDRYREPEVEAQIRWLLRCSQQEICERARQRSSATSFLIKEETLVYLFRTYIDGGDARAAGEIAALLIERTSAYIHNAVRHLKRYSTLHFEECVETVQHQMLTDLMDRTVRHEFWEVKFWVCLKKRLLNAAEKTTRIVRNECNPTPLTDDSGGEKNMLELLADPEAPSAQAQVEAKEALEMLSRKQLQAARLHYCEHWTQEEVARHFHVTDRTIRNWLADALEKLRDYYGIAH